MYKVIILIMVMLAFGCGDDDDDTEDYECEEFAEFAISCAAEESGLSPGSLDGVLLECRQSTNWGTCALNCKDQYYTWDALACYSYMQCQDNCKDIFG